MKLYFLVKGIYYLILTLILLSVGVTVYFLYDNLYNTLAQAKVVYVLKSQVAYKIIDTTLWTKVEDSLNKKKTLHLTATTLVADPFIPFIEIKEETKKE